MSVRSFVDTNVLIYAAAGKSDAPSKYRRARAIITSELFGLSGQVLQEFFVTAVRQAQKPLSVPDAFRWIERLEQFPFVPIDANLVKAAIHLSVRYQISYWDAAIVAAAERLGASILYSEDLNHGQVYGSVRVENPFLSP
jgi:predicted nucleic acid-binding protein